MKTDRKQELTWLIILACGRCPSLRITQGPQCDRAPGLCRYKRARKWLAELEAQKNTN